MLQVTSLNLKIKNNLWEYAIKLYWWFKLYLISCPRSLLSLSRAMSKVPFWFLLVDGLTNSPKTVLSLASLATNCSVNCFWRPRTTAATLNLDVRRKRRLNVSLLLTWDNCFYYKLLNKKRLCEQWPKPRVTTNKSYWFRYFGIDYSHSSISSITLHGFVACTVCQTTVFGYWLLAKTMHHHHTYESYQVTIISNGWKTTQQHIFNRWKIWKMKVMQWYASLQDQVESPLNQNHRDEKPESKPSNPNIPPSLTKFSRQTGDWRR